MKKAVLKAGLIMEKIFNIYEIYFSSIVFIILFLTYVVLIVYRYVFRVSVDWMYELNTIAFIWCGIIAASYGSRAGNHIAFSVIYDKLSEKKKLVFRLIGNLFVLIMLIYFLPKAYSAVAFLVIRKSSIMKITFNIINFPFIVFIALTIIHHIKSLYEDIKLCKNMLKGKS